MKETTKKISKAPKLTTSTNCLPIPTLINFKLMTWTIKEEKTDNIGKITFWVHTSKAQLISIQNNDTNKVFGVSFQTPVYNSTGVAHILEHMVLNGSEKYPSKEPFAHLLKSSLKTFLNAFTYPDKTIYPIASENHTDFLNLMSVYLDAVFKPLLKSEAFAQEGWRINWQSNSPQFKGVVFNEMKGATLNPDWVAWQTIIQSLFPKSNYSYESGGLPLEIINLTHEELVKFHKSNYHPSNAKFWLWGDFDIEQCFQTITPYLTNTQTVSLTKVQPLEFPQQDQFTVNYPTNDPQTEDKYYGLFAWRLGEITNVNQLIKLQIIDKILIGNSGSPLRKKLIESNLGTDLAGYGLETDLSEAIYSIGLKNIKQKNIPKLKIIIIEELSNIAETLDLNTIESAINLIEFGWKEIDNSDKPTGLEIFTQAINFWSYHNKPLEIFRYADLFTEIRNQMLNGEAKHLIRFLIQKHPIWIELHPDPNYSTNLLKNEIETLNTRLSKLNNQELLELKQFDIQLSEWQQTPDSPETINLLPKFPIDQLNKQSKIHEHYITHLDNLTNIYVPTTNQNIIYGKLIFNLNSLDDKYWPYLDLYSNVVTEFGREGDYELFQKQLSKYFGGIGTGINVGNHLQTNELVTNLQLNFKFLDRYQKEPLNLIDEIINSNNFLNKSRINQLIKEMVSEFEDQITYNGHELIALKIGANLNQSSSYLETLKGTAQYLFLKNLKNNFKTNWPIIKQSLIDIHEIIVNNPQIIAIGSTNEKLAIDWQSKFKNILSTKSPTPTTRKIQPNLKNEILIWDTQVNYVGMGNHLPIIHNIGAFDSIIKYLRMDYLWDEIRVKGGAYGAKIDYDPINKTLIACSYRDPNIIESWERYTNIGNYLQSKLVNQSDIDHAIISCISGLDTPISNERLLNAITQRYLIGINDNWRQSIRNSILNLKATDFKIAGEILNQWNNRAIRAVLTNKDNTLKLNNQNNNFLNLEL